MNSQFALLSIVFMMSFVFLFDRVHYRNRFSAWLRGDKLMNHQELEQIQAIWSACQDN